MLNARNLAFHLPDSGLLFLLFKGVTGNVHAYMEVVARILAFCKCTGKLSMCTGKIKGVECLEIFGVYWENLGGENANPRTAPIDIAAECVPGNIVDHGGNTPLC